MNAVSPLLAETIRELQVLPSLANAVLGGGTSLALRYDHRESVDIDLLFPGIIGKEAYQQIEKEVYERFGESVIGLDYPCDDNDQFVFLRFYIRKEGEQIKVEILQNMGMLDDPDTLDDIRVLTERDIGMLKLMAVSNRCSFKDVYDLHYLTESIALPELLANLQEKETIRGGPEHRTIFDLDNEVSPTADPTLLLKFDEEVPVKGGRPAHSTHRFNIVNGINWLGAKASWRRKVKRLLDELKNPK